MSDDLSGITLDFNQHYADAQPPSTRQQVRQLFKLVERLHMSGAIDGIEQWVPIASQSNWKVRTAIAKMMPKRLKELKRSKAFLVTSTKGLANGLEVTTDLYVATTDSAQPFWIMVQYSRDVNDIYDIFSEPELRSCSTLDEEGMVESFEKVVGTSAPAYKVFVDLIHVLDKALEVKEMLTRALNDEIVRLRVDQEVWRSALRTPTE